MFVPLPVIAAVAIAVLVLLWIAVRRAQPLRRDLLQPPVTKAALPALPETVDSDVQALLARGEKIEAIRLVRETTRLDLRGAKELVERMEDSAARPARD